MATKFLEPGGDADFAVTTTNGFWAALTNSPAVATDFVHGNHQRSIKHGGGLGGTICKTASGTCADAGARISFYIYLNAYTSSDQFIMQVRKTGGLGTDGVFGIVLSSAGILKVFNSTPAQIGTNGATLSLGVWYRITVAYTITDATHNRIEVFKDSASTISITNATLIQVVSSRAVFGNIGIDATLDIRFSDHYIDDSNSLTNTGDIWVTAKRPFMNGTTNDFGTQIGAGSSGYGTGHAPQVNERPLSTTNGWSVATATKTEEYNIEPAAMGDFNISRATIIDYMGWASAGISTNRASSLIVNNVQSAIATTTTITAFSSVAGSATYPAGTGTDIGVISSDQNLTVSLYECGVVVAFIPGASGGLPILAAG